MRYESAADRANEDSAIAFLKRRWDCEFERISDSDRIDFCLRRKDQGAVAMAEYKRRYFSKDKYPEWFVSMNKWEAAKHYWDTYGLPAFFVIEWDDGMYYLRVDQVEKIRLDVGGRGDRGDPRDREMMIYVSTKYFKPLRMPQDDRLAA